MGCSSGSSLKEEKEKNEERMSTKNIENLKINSIQEKIVNKKQENKERNVIQEKVTVYKEKQNENNNTFFLGEKLIFKYENEKEIIDSAFIFKDGDIIIFKSTFSEIYNIETGKEKLRLNFLGSILVFCYLNEETFISNKNSFFNIYKFLNNRTGFQLIQTINFPQNCFAYKIYYLTNRDIICQIYSHYETRLLIYTKEIDNEEYVQSNDYSHTIKNIDEIIELNTDKFLTIKKTVNDELIFNLYKTQDYKLIKSNAICLRSDRNKVIYFIFTFNKINENKIINGNLNNIFIFDLQMLDLETIINFNDFKINKLKYINNETILIIGEDEKCNNNLFDFENRVIFKKLKMDFFLNDIIDEKKEDMTTYIGEYISLFQIENYWDKWIYSLVGKTVLRIYSG